MSASYARPSRLVHLDKAVAASNDDADEEKLHRNAESARRLGEGWHDLGSLVGHGFNDLVRLAVHDDGSLY
jgi:hypothetical protein